MAADPHTITDLSRALKARETTAEAVVERCLQRIAERNATLNAFIVVFGDEAREQAREADREIAAGRQRGPLHGVPISLKDLFDVCGAPTTAASRVRRHHVAGADAPSVAALRDAGAIIIGKTNLHEFAFGTTNEDSAFGPARHPLDLNRSPGGSSGGSAASVADGMCFASMGTDTGGSIRIPSAVCGLVGLKPTFGELPTGGVVPLSTTLDHIGPICRSVDDAAMLYDVLLGDGARPAGTPIDPRALRLGVPRSYFLSLLDPQVAFVFESACERLREAGATLEDVPIPHAGDVAAIYLHIVLTEAAAYHAKTLERRPEDYTPNVRIRLEMGRYILGEDYARAMRGRELIRREVDGALEGRDGLFLPALAIPAPKLGVATVRVGAVEEPVRNVMLRCTQAFNVSGHPAISIPCGATTDGLPVGAQLVGGYGDTPGLLRAARAVEPIVAAGAAAHAGYLGPGISR
ncbi:MAG TPA: amidase [Vicinamibacterales bacterium]|jgi:aspartyl-tRNA(Asn)/glutamyl-tRNA(Gln) amidotransferase subunit A